MNRVDLTIEHHIAEIRLSNPAKLNAFTPKMLGQLAAHCQTLEKSPKVRVVLLTADVSKAFCAGADINAWGDLSPASFAHYWIRDGHRVFDQLARLSKPTIAVVSGHAFGGGLELAGACDVRVMHSAAMLALPEPSLGMVPGWSGTQRLARLLPESVIKEMIFFGHRINAIHAQNLGFVAEVSDEPLLIAKKMADAVLSKSPQALEIAKYMLHANVGEDRACMIDALGGGMMVGHSDKNEGVSAFREKRCANFSDDN